MVSMAKILAENLCRCFENEVEGNDIPESEKLPNFLTIIDDAVWPYRDCFSTSLETSKIMVCTEIMEIASNSDIREMALNAVRRISDEQSKARV